VTQLNALATPRHNY